jgi:hypothetical protein
VRGIGVRHPERWANAATSVIGVLGQLAVAHTGVVLLLVPADPLRPRRADGHFAAEAAAARDAGHDVVLVDHEALAEPGGAGRAVARVRDGGGRAVYRGWMLATDRYAAFAEALTARGVTLRTSAGQYCRAHELPGWYPALAPVTPAAVWTAGEGEEEFRAACERLGAGTCGAARLRQVDEALLARGRLHPRYCRPRRRVEGRGPVP